MARTDPQLNIRIPAALKDALDSVADKNKRSTTAEIVARLQKSFEEPAATEVPWDLRLEQRALESRIDTLRAHLMTLRMYSDVLDSKCRKAVADGAPENEVRAFKLELSEIVIDDQRIQDQLKDLVAQSHALDRQYADATRTILERMNVTVEKQLQADYRQLHDTESKLGIPKELRTVHVIDTPINPAPDNPPQSKPLYPKSGAITKEKKR